MELEAVAEGYRVCNPLAIEGEQPEEKTEDGNGSTRPLPPKRPPPISSKPHVHLQSSTASPAQVKCM